jgi:HlyD family secretion protein
LLFCSPLLQVVLMRFFLPLLLILSFAGLHFSCEKKEDKAIAQLKDITQAVYASGKIYPLDYYRLNVSIPGYIQAIHVKIGDTVEVGQPLFTMKSEVSNLNVSTAKNNLELAQLNASETSAALTAARQDLALAKDKLELDSVNLARVQALAEGNATTRVNLDQARAQYNASAKNYRKAQAALNFTRQRLGTEVRNADNLYKAQLSNSNDFTYYSSVSGKVYDLAGKQGEYYTPQQIIMELGKTGDFEVELSVDEADIHYLAKNQEVVYQTEAYPNLFLKGEIREVYPKIGSTSKSIKVMASINLPEGITMYAGATLEANIINQRKKNALVIPRYYLSNDSIWVKRKGSDRKEKILVKTGVGDVEFVEILEGLKAGDEVYKL